MGNVERNKTAEQICS